MLFWGRENLPKPTLEVDATFKNNLCKLLRQLNHHAKKIAWSWVNACLVKDKAIDCSHSPIFFCVVVTANHQMPPCYFSPSPVPTGIFHSRHISLTVKTKMTACWTWQSTAPTTWKNKTLWTVQDNQKLSSLDMKQTLSQTKVSFCPSKTRELEFLL